MADKEIGILDEATNTIMTTEEYRKPFNYSLLCLDTDCPVCGTAINADLSAGGLRTIKIVGGEVFLNARSRDEDDEDYPDDELGPSPVQDASLEMEPTGPAASVNPYLGGRGAPPGFDPHTRMSLKTIQAQRRWGRNETDMVDPIDTGLPLNFRHGKVFCPKCGLYKKEFQFTKYIDLTCSVIRRLEINVTQVTASLPNLIAVYDHIVKLTAETKRLYEDRMFHDLWYNTYWPPLDEKVYGNIPRQCAMMDDAFPVFADWLGDNDYTENEAAVRRAIDNDRAEEELRDKNAKIANEFMDMAHPMDPMDSLFGREGDRDL